MSAIRLIQPSDCLAVLDIYTPYVLNTAITFDEQVPTEQEFAQKIKTITEYYPWLVYERDGVVLGYAYGSKHREKSAYQWSVESTIYVSQNIHGKGIGAILYSTLLSVLQLQGFYRVYGGVLVPNPKSEALHRSMGFSAVGVFHQIGFKLGAWQDVCWFERTLSQANPLPTGRPVTILEVQDSVDFQRILVEVNRNLSFL